MGVSDLSIELGDTAKYRCPCCGRDSETVHGFLYDPTGATAVYFAGYAHGHLERAANLVLSIGGWGENTTPTDRAAIAMRAVYASGQIVMTFPPAKTSPWYGEELLGKMLEPEEISDTDRKEYLQVAALVLDRDPRVSNYMQNG